MHRDGREPGRLREARYLAQDVAYQLRRAARPAASALGSAARSARSRWLGLAPRIRRALLAGVAVSAAVMAIVLAAGAALPCGLPGTGECPPPDEAIGLVPAEAGAYAHIDLDQETEQARKARRLLAELPAIGGEIVSGALASLPGAGGSALEFETRLAPWLGGEIAIARIGTPAGESERLLLLEAGDPQGALAYGERLTGAAERKSHRGVELRAGRRGRTTALLGGFLAVGDEAAVRAAIDVRAGSPQSPSLADDGAAAAALARLPETRLAHAYLSAEGAEELVDDGPLAQLEAFVDVGATRGVAAALVVEEDAFTIALRSVLDPSRAERDPGFLSALPGFEPELPSELSPETLAYAGLGEVAEVVDGLGGEVSSEAPAIAEALSALGRRADRLSEVDLDSELVPALGSEVAVAVQPAVEPAEGGEEGAISPIVSTPVPLLTFLAADVDSERAGQALARLQRPVAVALDPGGSGRAAAFREVDLDGVVARSLRVSRTVDLTYAIADGLLAISTRPEGLAAELEREGLADTEPYRRATEGFAERMALLAFADLAGLIELAEREGLAADPLYASFASELRRLQSAALSVRREGDELATDARLTLLE